MSDASSMKLSGPRGWPFLGEETIALKRGPGFAAADFEKAMEHAADREELLLQALRIAGVGGWELDIGTNTLSWSEETYRIFGVSPDSFTPCSDAFYALVHPDDRKRLLANQDRSGDEQSFFDSEYRIVTPAGELRRVRSRAQVVPRGKERSSRFLGICQDVTELRQVEETLEQQRLMAQKLQGELIHISRVSAMGVMASALAHELNQPLTAIANYASGLRKLEKRGEGDGDTLLAALAAIQTNAMRAGEIIRRLRAMTTRGEIKTAPIELAECLVEAADLALTGANVRATYDFVPDLWVEADRIQLQQVVINLARNAIEAMESSSEKHIVIRSRPNGDCVDIIVQDSGPGIPPDLFATMFDSFVSTKSHGMGVGLAISRTIVEAHGGSLVAGEAPGGGSMFTVSLPRSELPGLPD